MKVRIYFDDTGAVEAVQWHWDFINNPSDEEVFKMKLMPQYSHLNSAFVDSALIGSEEYTQQLFYENAALKVDVNKDRNVMPIKMIRVKKIRKLQNEINDELEKENSDFKIIFKNQNLIRELSGKVSKEHDKFWLEEALKGLDKAEIEKPLIRQKLQERIKEV